MPRTRLIAVGATGIDSILTVPFFPAQDSKLRALSLTKRRGGNSANSLEVLQQLIEAEQYLHDIEIYLIATLPSQNSADSVYIASSFGNIGSATCSNAGDQYKTTSGVYLENCIYREDHTEAVSSYIISSEADSTRTIINHNPLPEMTFEEFKSRTDFCLPFVENDPKEARHAWIHFEGRIPEITLQCMQYVRQISQLYGISTRISVEIEKPHRLGLQRLANEADVVFYSRNWSEGEGHRSASACLQGQLGLLRDHSTTDGKLLICTWGADGACGTRRVSATETVDSEPMLVHSPAYTQEDRAIVDTTGKLRAWHVGKLTMSSARGW